MTIVKCNSPEFLLRELHHLQSELSWGSWLFRGHGDVTWKLTPSLFRQDFGRSDPADLSETADEWITRKETAFEDLILARLRSSLGRRSIVPDRLLGDDDYLLALAQHYGCPTRMLDWTRNPLQAAYFAASDAIRLGTDVLSIYAFAPGTMKGPHMARCHVVVPSSGANENLAAQSGILIKHPSSCRDYWHPSYGEPFTEDRPTIVSGSLGDIIRFDINYEHAGRLLRALSARGIDAVSSFPGPLGFVREALDAGWTAQRKLTPGFDGNQRS